VAGICPYSDCLTLTLTLTPAVDGLVVDMRGTFDYGMWMNNMASAGTRSLVGWVRGDE
jgi:hypothetical protein